MSTRFFPIVSQVQNGASLVQIANAALRAVAEALNSTPERAKAWLCLRPIDCTRLSLWQARPNLQRLEFWTPNRRVGNPDNSRPEHANAYESDSIAER